MGIWKNNSFILQSIIKSFIAFVFFFLLCGFDYIESPAQKKVNILVVAIYGVETAKEEWQPTIDYLQSSLPEYEFKLIPVRPIELDRIKKLVASREIDFVITQPAIYVDLELNFGISRILTMVKKGGVSEFGSTLITRADSGIGTVKDLHGKTIAGVAKLGFGGWLVGYKEMLNHDFDPFRDAKEVKFLGDQPREVQAVLDGVVDAAVIRTGVLESYIESNRISLDDFHILAQKNYSDFNLLVSTALYPEWAFAKTRSASNEMSKEVALSLLAMGRFNQAALKAGFQEWTFPYDYQPVHDLLKELRIGPYKDYGKITVRGFVAQHMIETIILIAFVILISLMTILLYRSNISLSKEIVARKQAETDLNRHADELEKALSEIKTLQGIIPICSNCKKIRTDEGDWEQIEAYVRENSEADFSHGICPECMRKLYPDFDEL